MAVEAEEVERVEEWRGSAEEVCMMTGADNWATEEYER